jgi:hypothetical protein
MNEHVFVAPLGLHEAVTLGVIEPLDNTVDHLRTPPGVAAG